jgi:hypothetical protein
MGMEKEIKILMLEDMEEDAWLIDRALQKEKIAFNRVRVDTRDEFKDALHQAGCYFIGPLIA